MPQYLSIGDVAIATGFTPDTLRVWERRYGGPVPVRLPSGHRRYTREQVLWLRRVGEALSQGHRPAQVVPLPAEELTRMLEQASRPAGKPRQAGVWIELVHEYRDVELRANLEASLERVGALATMQEVIGPLLTSMGRMWADGQLEVRHEHFATELLNDWIRSKRALREARNAGPTAIVATLPGESHSLGLQLAAWVCAECGLRLRVLGTEVPLDQLCIAVRETGAQLLLLSVSLSTGGIYTDRMISQVRRELPADTPLVIGGSGARGVRRVPRGVDCLDGLGGLDTWLRRRFESAQAVDRL